MLVATFLIVGIFFLSYITLYNQRKKKDFLQKTAMKKEFEQELTKTQMEVQEHTLKTIASDIHDNIGQLLSITKLTLSSIQPEGDANKNNKKLTNAKDLLDNATTELRQLASLLHADNLLAKGLQNAIDIELSWMKKSERMHIDYSAKGTKTGSIPPQTELIAYRITQELLNNIIKHSEASDVRITLSYLNDGIEIFIGDNGKGFSIAEIQKEGTGLGMRTLFNRAKMIGANLQLDSEEGKGTKAILFIPYQNRSLYERAPH